MPHPADRATLLANAAHIERRDAEILLAAAERASRAMLIADPHAVVDEAAAQRFAQLVARRAAGEPVAYLLGRREFWSMAFEVSPAVLVPRPETELLVERVLELVTAPDANVVDLGTGSGAIAITLAVERPGWRVVATDVSREALDVARANGDRLAPGRIEWMRAGSGWFELFRGQRFDAIVSNPPYIDAADPALNDDGVRFEPRLALTPGGDGFSALQAIIDGAPAHLARASVLALEHGSDQGARVRAALVARGFAAVTSHRDLAGHERVTTAQWPHQE